MSKVRFSGEKPGNARYADLIPFWSKRLSLEYWSTGVSGSTFDVLAVVEVVVVFVLALVVEGDVLVLVENLFFE